MAKSGGPAPVGTGSEPLKTVGFPSLDTASLKANRPPLQAAELVRLEAPLQPKKRLLPVQAAGLRIKELGYDPIALRDGKDKPNIGWPRTPNTPDRIRRWTGRTIAVRFKGSDLFVIDLDVHVAAVRDAIVAALTARWPEFMACCLRRHSQSGHARADRPRVDGQAVPSPPGGSPARGPVRRATGSNFSPATA